YRRMLNRARSLHLGNDDERRLTEPLGLHPKSFIIPNGIFLSEFDPLPSPGTFCEAHPELRGDPFILFLSRLHHKKGLDILADAFAIVAVKMPKVRLVVAGADDGAKHSFEQRIKALGLTRRVHLVGPLYGRQKLAALVDASSFCLPSRQEGFSIAIL